MSGDLIVADARTCAEFELVVKPYSCTNAPRDPRC